MRITIRLVEVLGGHISVNSQEGVGSTFFVIVPVAPNGELIVFDWDTSLPESPENESPSHAHFAHPLEQKTLIADDIADIR